ncbi:MAG: DUF935 family protein [Bacteroidetes bacterium]|nr:DUF935 family protein [Bacteroidota bacterium]
MAIELKTKKNVSAKEQQSLSSAYSKNVETEKIFRAYTREFSALDADSIKFYFDAAQKGINFYKAFLFEEIRRRDLRIGSICQTRKLSVLDYEHTIEGDNEQHVEFIKENFARINFNQFLADIVEAQLQGMSVFQLFYDFIGTKQVLRDIALIPNYLIYNKNGIRFIDFSKLSFYTLRAEVHAENPSLPFVELDPMYYFEAYSFDGNSENGLLNGLIDSIIWGYFFKSYGLKDWSVFLERFAMPSVIGKYDPLMSKPDRDTLTKAVNDFGNLFRATIPNTAEITVQGDANKMSAGTLYENYLKYWNDELSIRALGQAQTTDTSEGGSFAKAKVGNIVREDYMRGDKALIASVINAFIKKLIDLNFANIGEYPVFTFLESEKLDYKLQKADLLVKLRTAGFEVEDETELENVFGFKLIKSAPPANSGPFPAFAENLPKKKKAQIENYLLELWSNAQQ